MPLQSIVPFKVSWIIIAVGLLLLPSATTGRAAQAWNDRGVWGDDGAWGGLEIWDEDEDRGGRGTWDKDEDRGDHGAWDDDSAWGADGADWDDWLLFDEDALFGTDDGFVIDADDGTERSFEEVFLVKPGVDVGGSVHFGIDHEVGWAGEITPIQNDSSHTALTLDSSLYADARPRRDFRAFAKVKTDAEWHQDRFRMGMTLHELFVDFDLRERVYFRLGKQTAHWGVGHFFSPADIVSIGRIDPENPEEEREGPWALRVHTPWGRHHASTYVLFDGETSGRSAVALAPKAEFVTGNSEWGIGLFYQDGRAPRAMATLSTSVGPVALFAEGVVSRGSDKRLLRPVPPTGLSPHGLVAVHDRETLFFHATLGGRYTYADPDGRFQVRSVGQYYMNGEGYEGKFLQNNLLGIRTFFGDGELSEGDLREPGRHYAALSVRAALERWRNVAPHLFWIGNLSDGSGMVVLSLEFSGVKGIHPSIRFSRQYGDSFSEFAFSGVENRLTVGVSIGGDW